jgi:hypothetical protein
VTANVSDLVSAVFMSENYAAPTILIGHSFVGAAVLQSAREIPISVAVVTIGSPAQPSHRTAMFKDDRDEIERNGQATAQLGGRPFAIKKQLLDELEAHLLPESIAGLQRALLVMQSPVDNIVSIQNASDLFLHANPLRVFLASIGLTSFYQKNQILSMLVKL